MSIDQIETQLQQKAQEVADDLARIWEKANSFVKSDLGSLGTVVQAVGSDPLVKTAVEAALPASFRTLAASFIRSLESLPEVKAAYEAEKTAAGTTTAGTTPASTAAETAVDLPAAPATAGAAAS